MLLLSAAASGADPGQPTEGERISYVDVADSVSVAPIVAIATITKSKRLKGDMATGVPASEARFLVTAKLSALLRGVQGMPERIDYLVDMPLDPKGHPPKLAKRKVILAGAPVSGKPGMIQLVSPRAQMEWSPAREAQTRSVITQLVAADAPPRVTGVGNAFHVKGSLPGESETQIFLKTAGGEPVSLSILRRPGEDPHWAVALGEMIDEAAKPPERDTLLWYRLACFLPPTLPAESVANLSEDDAAATTADYGLVIDALGACERTPAP